MMHGSLSIFH
jgi:hypothetical protein